MRGAVMAVAALLALLAGGPATAAEPVTERGYLLVMGSFTDPEKRKAYSAALPPIYAAHGGRYLGVGGPGRGVEVLAGGWAPRGMVLALFDRPEAVQAFWDSPAYRAAVDLRQGAGRFDVLRLSGGVPGPAGPKSYLVEFLAGTADASAYRAAAGRTAAAHGGTVLVDLPAAATRLLEGEAPVPGFAHLLVLELPAGAADAAWTALRDEPARRALEPVSTVRLTGLPPG